MALMTAQVTSPRAGPCKWRWEGKGTFPSPLHPRAKSALTIDIYSTVVFEFLSARGLQSVLLDHFKEEWGSHRVVHPECWLHHGKKGDGLGAEEGTST